MTPCRRVGGAALLGLAVLTACSSDHVPTAASGGVTATRSGFFASGDAQLHYELALPSGAGPFPAVIFGHGSGPVTKTDGAVHEPFWIGQGFAVLRFDKRGAGQSTGTYRGVSAANSDTQIPELAADMVAGIAFLKARPDIDATRIGLTGVSQAGWVMAAAAAASADVRFVVAAVGSVAPVGVNIAYENLRDLPIDQAYTQLAQYTGPPGWDPVMALRAARAAFFYVLAGDDRLVPTRVCAPQLAALRQAGARVATRVVDGVGHELGSSTGFWPDVANWLRTEGIR